MAKLDRTRRTPDPLAVHALLAGMLLAVSMTLTACIQPRAVYEPFSVITLIVDVPETMTRAGIRTTLSGSGLISGDNDYGFTDSTGYSTIRTQQTGYHFVVARHQAYDMTVGGTAANLPPGGPLQVFQQGRLFIPSVGVTLSPDFFYPFTGVDEFPQQVPRRLGMRKKGAGKARFMFIVEDSDVLKKTLDPEHRPDAFGRVSVTGDWNGFNLTQEDVDPVNGARFLRDDGSFVDPEGGDDIAGDGVLTRVLGLPAGDHAYAFLINGITVYTRDAYEENSKQVRVVARIPTGYPGSPNALDVREFRASTIQVP